jgi:hypothetical protein
MYIDIPHEGFTYKVEEDGFSCGNTVIPIYDVARYLKGKYSRKDKVVDFINYFVICLGMQELKVKTASVKVLLKYWDTAIPFTYKEAFEIKDDGFRAVVFGSINIGTMIEELGHTRISTEGKEVTHKVYNPDGSHYMHTYNVIYEIHQVDLNEVFEIDRKAYVLKCWCTSTDKEHYLWVNEESALKGGLEAVASMCYVYENMLPYITSIKRQGDIFLFEMSEEVEPSGKIVNLNAEQYFSLLVAQS